MDNSLGTIPTYTVFLLTILALDYTKFSGGGICVTSFVMVGNWLGENAERKLSGGELIRGWGVSGGKCPWSCPVMERLTSC